MGAATVLISVQIWQVPKVSRAQDENLFEQRGIWRRDKMTDDDDDVRTDDGTDERTEYDDHNGTDEYT